MATQKPVTMSVAGNFKNLVVTDSLDVGVAVIMHETTAPALQAGIGQTYTKTSDGEFYFLDSAGNEYKISNPLVFSSTINGVVPASGGDTTTFLRADATFVTPPTFTSGAAGYTPASGGGTDNFLRADGNFAAPPGTNTGSGANNLLTLWTGTNTLGSDAALGYDSSTDSLILTRLSMTESAAPSLVAGKGQLYTLSTDNRVYFIDSSGVSYNLTLDRFTTLAYSASTTLDLDPSLPTYRSMTLTGDLSITGLTNKGNGRSLSIRIVGDSSQRTFTFNASWKFLGSGAPATIAANAVGILSLVAFGTAETDVIAMYNVTP
jgi:hypothetical protein